MNVQILPSGTFRVRIRRHGAPAISKSFASRDDAERYGRETEAAITSGTLAEHRHRETTLRELLTAYGVKKSSRKKGAAQELVRVEALRRDRIAAYSTANLSRGLFRDYRDRRLKTVTGSTFNRELSLLSACLKWARAELDAPVDPAALLAGLKQPETAARERRLQHGEFERLMLASPGWLRVWITVAIETCMRRGELAGLTWEQIDLARRVCRLPDTKNGTARHVPLSSTAIAALTPLQAASGPVFAVHRDNVTQEFARTCRRAGIVGLRLHDLRAEGVSRLFERGLDLNSVRSISGHKSLIIARYMRGGDAEALARRLG
jgi:integrase